MGEAIKVIIKETEDKWSYSLPARFEVHIKASPEFMREPEFMLTDEEKSEQISQRVKEEFYKYLMNAKDTKTTKG